LLLLLQLLLLVSIQLKRQIEGRQNPAKAEQHCLREIAVMCRSFA